MPRDDNFLNQEIFQESKSETEMMRYLNHLVEKDYSLYSWYDSFRVMHYEIKCGK